MTWLSKIVAIRSFYQGLAPELKGNIFRLGSVIFLLLFSYPMIRVTTTSFLLESFGAKGSPYAWCFSVVLLVFTVTIFNKAQKNNSIQRIYSVTVLTTLSLFILFFLFYKFVSPYGSYFLYIGKEVYIVVLVNSVLAHINTIIDKDTAKMVYGPLGAFSSIGGILGAYLTSILSRQIGGDFILGLGLVFVFISLFIFSRAGTKRIISKENIDKKKLSALKAIKSVRSYVFLIAILVLLSQFVINIANYKFNFFLTDYFSSNSERGEFLGRVYSLINLCSLLIQIFVIPLVLRFVPSFFTHLGIAGAYALAFLVPLVIGSPTLLSAAGTFIIFKGLDYSIFSAAKELLYFSLNDQQKYGAKYIVDMVFYRFSKGIISVILIVIPFGAIDWLLAASLVLWMAILFPLFKIYRNLKTNME